MTEHHWFREQLVEYATAQLSTEDMRLIEEHLPHCDDCRNEVDAIQHDLRYLGMAATPVPPRPGFAARTLEAATGRSQRSPRMAPWIITALAASTALAAGLAWQARATASTSAQTLAGLTNELAGSRATALALADTLSIVRKAGKVVYASLAMPGQAGGGVVLFDDATTHRWQVVAHGLPALPVGQRYQFWFVGEDGMLQGLPLVPSAAGSASLITGMPDSPPGKIMGAAITIESDQSAPNPTGHGPKIATLML
ncbi:MAG: anti-sigma factor [Gemmatimonadales bacterium]